MISFWKLFIFVFLVLHCGCRFNSNQEVKVYRGGQLVEQYQVDSAGARHGFYKAFYANGKDSVWSNFDCGKEDGVKVFFDKRGAVEKIMQLKNGELEQKVVTLRDGGLNQIASFKDGKFNGINYLFYENGMLEKIYFADDTVVSGPQYSYFDNGILGRFDFIYAGEVVYSEIFDKSGALSTREGYSIGGVKEYVGKGVIDSMVFSFVQPPGTNNLISVIEFDKSRCDTIFSAWDVSNYSLKHLDTLRNIKVVARIVDISRDESFESDMVLNIKKK